MALCCSCNSDSNNIKNHLSALNVILDIYSSQYEHFIVMGDFNVEVENRDMEEFCKNYNLKSLIPVPTCYKSPKNSLYIDLILANSQRSFQSSCTIETGLSNFHRMTITIMKASFQKLKPKVIHYRNYKRFCNESYRNELVADFSKQNFEENSLEKFLEVCNKVLDKHAPRKSKFVRGNHSPFMNRELWKAIITRTRLRNKFFKEKTAENRIIINNEITVLHS